MMAMRSLRAEVVPMAQQDPQSAKGDEKDGKRSKNNRKDALTNIEVCAGCGSV